MNVRRANVHVILVDDQGQVMPHHKTAYTEEGWADAEFGIIVLHVSRFW